MNIFAAPWRPAQVRFAPSMGQTPISIVPPAAAARPSLIDSPLMAVLFDAAIGVGSLTLATGYMKKAKTKPQEKSRYKPLGYLFFGLMGLSTVKLFVDGARLGQ